MPDEQMREINPVLARHYLQKGCFDFLRCAMPREAQPVTESGDVRVHDDAFCFAVRDSEDDVGSLAPNTGELDQCVQLVGNPPVILIGNDPASFADGAGFVAEEAGGTDDLFQITQRGRGEVRSSLVTGKQRRGDKVDASIRALGTENRRHEELQRVFVAQSATGIGVGSAEALEQFANKSEFGLGNAHQGRV